MLSRLLALFWRGDVSEAWVLENDRRECAEGWDGPRWKFPKEVAEDAKAARLKRIAEIRRQGWRKQA